MNVSLPSDTSPDETKRSRFKIALRALQYRNYRLFFAGQLVSLVGTWMQMIAQSWLVYRLTGSSFLLGAVGFASQIPLILFPAKNGLCFIFYYNDAAGRPSVPGVSKPDPCDRAGTS